jgi:hypothetical protein
MLLAFMDRHNLASSKVLVISSRTPLGSALPLLGSLGQSANLLLSID